MAHEPPPQVRVRWAAARAMHASDPFRQRQQAQLPTVLSPLASPQPLFAERTATGAAGVARVVGNSVTFAVLMPPVVERSFVFPERVHDAVFARFDSCTRRRQQQQQQRPPPDQLQQPHLCVLVRADCVNIYAPSGEVFEAALPFQASRLSAFGDAGLLLQRSPAPNQPPSPRRSQRTPNAFGATALFADSELASRPRFFTLAHPLDEVKPVAVEQDARSAAGASRASHSPQQQLQLLSDPALETVAFCAPEALLVCYHTDDRCFHVFRLCPVPAGPASRVAAVRVVDSATWRKHREDEAELDALDRVAISPDWVATLLWTSPAMEHMDLATILCLVDKAAGVLMLKRVDTLPTAK